MCSPHPLRILFSLTGSLGISLATGCVSGSLASNTGPAPQGQRWSMDARQWVHVGETVRFDFVLQDMWGKRVNSLGWADYAAVTFGRKRIEIEPDNSGRFQFSATFDEHSAGSTLRFRVSAYRQRGDRDYMNVDGEWLRSMSPSDVSDDEIASDTIEFQVYETQIAIEIPRPATELEIDSGVLRLHRRDQRTKAVYIDRPDRPGFLIEGPEPEGKYRIRYRPGGNEVNQTDQTKAHFMIYDLNGGVHEKELVLDTP